ncbi:hypothetical protein UFOVP340_41 [uncultured Caudovirales phage]|uniref:Uncharacterized protein n=1 Tax=uncultured Caudovirales phage TaxID=2100421 RepID=A0A6J5M1S7_9CAUD|nr:hypothetical protein UFOVP340_41 [uncultured Caudovirales phage]
MGVDFNRISFGISSGISRTGFGSIVSSPSGPSFPAAGTITGYTALQEYPILNGGTWFYSPLGGEVPNQNATFAIKADGSGGTYTDYGTTGTVSYKPPGIFATDNANPTVLYINISGSDYAGGNSYPAYSHDGSGSYNSVTSTIWYPYGTGLNSVSNQSYVNGEYYDNGTSTAYNADGNGGWYSFSSGNYYASGTIITQNITGETGTYVYLFGTYYYPVYQGNKYTWNGEGGYNYAAEWPKPYGTAITTGPSQTAVPDTSSNYYNNGKTTNYFWQGDGSTYYTTETGSFYSNGTLVYQNETSNSTFSLPSGFNVTGTYYGEKYTWNGSGGYNYESTWYVPYGTYIEYYDGYNYYHDGAGYYYSYFV